VAFLTFALNYAVGGYSTFGYHLVNLIIHTVNGLFVYWLVLMTFETPVMERSFKDKGPEVKCFIALATALVFVSHPVQTQAVTYITQRFASLATLFYLLSLAFFVMWRKYMENPGQRGRTAFYVLSLASAVLAMKTKEISFTLPFIIVLYDFAFFPGKTSRQRLIYLVPFLLTLAIVPLSLLSPESASGGAAAIDERLRENQLRDLTAMPRYDYLVTQFMVIITYLRLLVFPAGQRMYYDYPVFHSFLEQEVFLSFLFIFTLLCFAIFLFTRSRETDNGYGLLISFGVLWFFITLSVESSVIPIKDVIAEHRVYLPSVGLFTAFTATVSYAFFSARRNPEAAWALVCVIVVLLSIAAHKRNYVWADRLSFWLDEAGKSPARAEVHNGLGSAYYDLGRLEEAKAEYEKAILLAPGYARAHNNLAMVFKGLGRPEKAIEHLHAAISLDPELSGAYYNLGNVFNDLGLADYAVYNFKKALALDPDLALAHYFLGEVLKGQGKTEEAIGEFREAIRLKPDLHKAHNSLGVAYYELGRLDEAINEYKLALILKPDYPGAHLNLGLAYLKKGLTGEAAKEFEAALKIRPDDAKARKLLESLKAQ
jgi:tetratricopeptide (TPR) repeat protein